jgi:hypothetical protein
MNKTNYARSRLDAALDARACAEYGHDWTNEVRPGDGLRFCRRRCLAVLYPDGHTVEPAWDWRAELALAGRYGAESREVR